MIQGSESENCLLIKTYFIGEITDLPSQQNFKYKISC